MDEEPSDACRAVVKMASNNCKIASKRFLRSVLPACLYNDVLTIIESFAFTYYTEYVLFAIDVGVLLLGQPHGKSMRFDVTTGATMSINNYFYGEACGEHIELLLNGQLHSYANYVYGKECTFTRYFSNGKKKEQYGYANGKRRGKSTTWNKYGEVIMRFDYG